MEIPTDVRTAIDVNPGMMIIYALPKAGKTSICAGLKNHLIVELENGGADYVDCRVVEITKATFFNELLEDIKKSEKPVCDYLVIDTITKLDEYSEIVGTYQYMDKGVGKKFNQGLAENGVTIVRLKHTDPKFQTVHEIGQGYGYQYSRAVMSNWYNKLSELILLKKVKHIILIAHVKDKFVETKTGDMVESIDLSLTGKVKGIYSSRVDAIAYLTRKGNKAFLSFENDGKVICGGRCSHLTGSIEISELNNGKLITHWDRVFIPDKK